MSYSKAKVCFKLSTSEYALLALLLMLALFGISCGAYTSENEYGCSLEPISKRDVNTLPEEVYLNMLDSDSLMREFYKAIPYNGAFKAQSSTGEYTVDGYYADQFPDYYGGNFTNIDGKLIIQIQEDYYKDDYRTCDWYKELVEMLGSEDFYCHPVKYNYTALINGMSDICFGKKAKALKEAGIEWVTAGFSEYGNHIGVALKNADDLKKARKILDSDLFSVTVHEGVVQDN